MRTLVLLAVGCVAILGLPGWAGSTAGPRLLTWDQVASIRGLDGPVQVPGATCRSKSYQCPHVYDCPADDEPCFTCSLTTTTRRKCEVTSQPRDICRPIENGLHICPFKQQGTRMVIDEESVCTNPTSTGTRCSEARHLCN